MKQPNPGIFIGDEGAINARGMRKRIRGCSKGKHVFSRWGRVRYEQEQENTRLFQGQTRLYSFHVGDARGTGKRIRGCSMGKHVFFSLGE